MEIIWYNSSGIKVFNFKSRKKHQKGKNFVYEIRSAWSYVDGKTYFPCIEDHLEVRREGVGRTGIKQGSYRS